MPQLEKKNKMLCKHMVAIFENAKYVRWESLAEAYKTSPYLSLDNTVISSTTDHPQHSKEE